MKALIVFIICIFTFCVNIFADGVMPVGSGTEDDPYSIETLDNLLYLSTNSNLWVSGLYFKQTADIDASDTANWNDETGFSPIGICDADSVYEPFSGFYNGDDHTINNLYINHVETHSDGLFGNTFECTIQNLGLTNVSITGDNSVGALVGYNERSNINSVYSTGVISASDGYAGEIDEYNGMIEIGDFSYQIVETGIDISEYTIDMSISQVLNGSEFVGTFISLSGILVYLPYYAGGGWNMMISDESNDIIIRIWDSTGIEVSNFEVGQILDINGIIGIFNNQAQILPGYPEDISIDVNIEDDQIINSDHLCLLNNYPNPFNPETTIKFSVKESETAKLSIYNMKGQNVKSYPVFNSGNHSALWDGLDNYGNKISSGVYLYKVHLPRDYCLY